MRESEGGVGGWEYRAQQGAEEEERGGRVAGRQGRGSSLKQIKENYKITPWYQHDHLYSDVMFEY